MGIKIVELCELLRRSKMSAKYTLEGILASYEESVKKFGGLSGFGHHKFLISLLRELQEYRLSDPKYTIMKAVPEKED